MISNSTYTTETSDYWNLIKDVKDEIKIRLITLLSESLSNSLSVRIAKKENDEATEKFIQKYYGAWRCTQSPEEIIDIINHFDRIPNLTVENWVDR